MLLWWTVACVSLVDTQREWKSYLDGLPDCDVDADCAIIEPGCPLGCYASVPLDSRSEAEPVAADLVDQYRTGLRPCTYECGPRPMGICDDKRCETGVDPGDSL